MKIHVFLAGFYRLRGVSFVRDFTLLPICFSMTPLRHPRSDHVDIVQKLYKTDFSNFLYVIDYKVGSHIGLFIPRVQEGHVMGGHVNAQAFSCHTFSVFLNLITLQNTSNPPQLS